MTIAQGLLVVSIAINLLMFVFFAMRIGDVDKKAASDISGLRNELQSLNQQSAQNLQELNYNISELLEKLRNESKARVENLRHELDYSSIINESLESVVLIIWEDNNTIGSGFIVSEDGYIFTADHVVEDFENKTVRVMSRGGDIYNASVKARNKTIDVAVLKVNRTFEEYLEFSPSKSLTPGSRVFALGAPEGLSFSASEGIVSAVRTVAKMEAETGMDLGLGMNVTIVQTDAAITYGNSGGPLVDKNGDVVGLNSFGISRRTSGSYQDVAGLNFAISSEDAISVFPNATDRLEQ